MKFLHIFIACLLVLSTSLAMAGGKESGEKGGTEDINIGVGELQEQTVPSRLTTEEGSAAPGGPVDLKNEDDKPKAGLLLPAVQSRAGGSSKKKGNVETEFKVEKGEK